MKHLLSLDDWSHQEVLDLLELADTVKRTPQVFATALSGKTLLMLFEKPSLRTRLSFESGMHQMGGHAIYYDTTNSPLGKGKETVSDTARVAGRFVDLIMARLYDHAWLEEIALNAQVPVINALTNASHPCQILADLQTIREKKGTLKGLSLAYLGDAENNVTYSLMIGCAKVGIHVSVGCPEAEEYRPITTAIERAARVGAEQGATIRVVHDADEAVAGADIVYTDSWMSYHIAPDQVDRRVVALKPYQVTSERMKRAREDAIFMNCLPAMRGYEQTAEVIDGAQSVVFDEAENRLHAQKAVMLRLMGAA